MSSSQQLLLGEGAGGGAAPVYIEDVFSTYLYTGTGASQTITNGIDLSTKGGLTWIKGRSGATGHRFTDTARGVTKSLASNSTAAEVTETTGLTAFGTTGFTIGADADYNTSAATYVSWSLRKQQKFFDIVTYTGDGIAGKTINHNLGSTPGFIIVKGVDVARAWFCYHSSLGPTKYIRLDDTGAAQTDSTYWNDTAPTSTQFTVGGATGTNFSGYQFVAYIFAHDAGGFGLTGSDNVISCGSFTTDGSGLASVTLGYEPQWMMLKASTASEPWNITDTMRGWTQTGTNDIRYLQANTSGAEASASNNWEPNSTGFSVIGGLSSSTTYIYIAIRRGPMKVPTSGTSVYAVNFGSDVTTYTTNFPLDMGWDGYTLGGATDFMAVGARLLGQNSLATASTASQSTALISSNFWQSNTSYRFNVYGNDCATYAFRRAPSFFDVVCYTGNGTSGRTVAHNLAASPELMIARQRTGGDWYVYASGTGATKFLVLNATDAAVTDSSLWNNTAPTSSVFTLGDATGVNRSATNFIAYLFATCAGVSKVGSYTGNGSTQTIDCGFGAGGARFVLIKRTDSTGAWYLYDSARGMTTLTNPYLRLNSTSAEVATLGSVTTVSTGFALNSAILAAINVNAGTYIFLAIA